jgi:hypothetical protein
VGVGVVGRSKGNYNSQSKNRGGVGSAVDRMQRYNNRLDALTFTMMGHTTNWIGCRFGVTHQTVSNCVKEARGDARVVKAAEKRVTRARELAEGGWGE